MPRRHRRLCSREDPARLRGTGCTLASPTGCGIVYALFRMSNGKLLVPGERGLVGASASAEAGAAPLEAAAWRLIEVEGSWSRGGWVQLRHVLSGAFLRLVPPRSHTRRRAEGGHYPPPRTPHRLPAATDRTTKMYTFFEARLANAPNSW